MDFDIEKLNAEVMEALSSVDVDADGEHLHSNYQNIIAWTLRLQELHNMIAMEELRGRADAALKKYRTSILGPTIERLDKAAAYESRKITSRQIEATLNK